MLDLVEDNVAVVRPLGEENSVIVGHDWGSNIASASALLHPEAFRAVALLSVPYAPPGGPRPTDVFGRIGGPEQEFYVSYLLPAWLSEDDLDVYAGALDASTTWMSEAIDAYPTTLPGPSASHLLGGCSRWIRQERPDEVNRLLTGWLATLQS